MKKWFQILCLAVLGFWGCALGQSGKQISAAELNKLIESDEKIQLVDVRTPEEFAEGKIQGAIRADWKNPKEFKSVTKELDKSRPVYAYCLAGVRSADAAAALRKQGFTVIELTGGIKAWRKEGFPTTNQ
ncbi:MAG TPA: rhodanese-like domain-containing protein [Flavihumibacter sp.]|jgi:thioredoxin 1